MLRWFPPAIYLHCAIIHVSVCVCRNSSLVVRLLQSCVSSWPQAEGKSLYQLYIVIISPSICLTRKLCYHKDDRAMRDCALHKWIEWVVAEIWPFKIIQLGFDVTGNSAIRSANLENPTLEPNMKCIGSPVAEIWPFAYLWAYGTPILGEGAYGVSDGTIQKSGGGFL